MVLFPCPYLKGEVEMTEERQEHISTRHPDLLPEYADLIAPTLAAPDAVRRSDRLGSARLFSRKFVEIKGGIYVVVVVMTDSGITSRHWIVTAYFARRLAAGENEWQRS